MIPLLHDFENETVLVFGGGPVGARKARRFAREATVVVVSPAFADESFEPSADDPFEADDPLEGADDDPFEDADEPVDGSGDGAVELVRAAPAPEDVGTWLDRVEPALAVAATDDAAVNEAVVSAARERGVLVNRADRSGGRDPGSVAVPATVRDGDVVVAVSTDGTAPALSKHLREEFEDRLDGASEMAALLAALRTRLKERELPPERRREVVRDVVNSPGVWTTLRTGDSNYERVIEDVLREMGDGGEPR